MKKFEG